MYRQGNYHYAIVTCTCLIMLLIMITQSLRPSNNFHFMQLFLLVIKTSLFNGNPLQTNVPQTNNVYQNKLRACV